jgi:hypothetical protein
MSAKDKAKDYINDVYDNIASEEQKRITDIYKQTGQRLDQQQTDVQQQTNDYLQRTEVEAQQVAGDWEKQRVSEAAKQQAALSMENQKRKNTRMLQDGQAEAEAEIERMRKLYADIFSSEIKKAQADNDMARAQALYEAAKAKDAELLDFGTKNPAAENADYINAIYDSAVESQTQEVQQELAAALSALNAQKSQITAAQDESLNDAYINALQSRQRANEVQAARGTGSGTKGQQALEAGNQMTEEMTELRKVYAGNLADVGMQGVQAQHEAATETEKARAAAEREKAQAIYADILRKGGGGGSGSGRGGEFDQDIYNLQAQLRKFGYNVPLNGQDSDALQRAYEDALAKGWFNTNRGGTGGSTNINHQQSSVK